MFNKKFEATIKSIKLRRVRDDDGGGIHADMVLTMPLDKARLKELGEGVEALVESREKDGGTLPFKEAKLEQSHSGLVLAVFDVNGEKFNATDCEAKRLKLKKNSDTPAKPILEWVVVVPPLKQQFRNFLINRIEDEVEFKLEQQQTELEVN